MTARWPHVGPAVPEQGRLPATMPSVSRGTWKRIAQQTIRDLAYARMRIEQLEEQLAAAKAAKGER